MGWDRMHWVARSTEPARPSRPARAARVRFVDELQDRLGNRGAAQFLRAAQAKLEIGRASDPLEDEADRVADALAVDVSPSPKAVQRTCAACAAGQPCEQCRAPMLQPKRAPGHHDEAAAPESVERALRSSGRPLDDETRDYFEPQFGRDLGDVRVHTEGEAAQSARAVGAQAYTVGCDIVLASSAPDASSAEGRKLLAHELTHVVQQSGGGEARGAGAISDGAAARVQRQLDSAAPAQTMDAAAAQPTATTHPQCPNAQSTLSFFAMGASKFFPTTGVAVVKSGGTVSFLNVASPSAPTFEITIDNGVTSPSTLTVAPGSRVDVRAITVTNDIGGNIIATNTSDGSKSYFDLVVCA
jgi:Domain of unknown function (DUF4157)